MARKRLGSVTAVLVFGFFTASAVNLFADEPVNNATLLKEIRELRKLVDQQARKISELESRIPRQQSSSAVSTANSDDMDTSIEERLAERKGKEQLMEGLDIDVSVTTVLQSGHNTNGADQSSAGEDSTSGSVKTDFYLEKKFDDYATAFVYLTAGKGAGIDARLKTFGSANFAINDDGNVGMSEAWYEQHIPDLSCDLTFGKLDATGYIDTNSYANDETIQFLNGIFGNSPVVEFPNNGLGVRLGSAPLEFLDLEAIALDADGNGQDLFDGMFLAGQANFKPKFLGRNGNYRFYVWQNGSNHARWNDASKDKKKSYGCGLSFDQELTDVAGVFLRYGWQDPKVYVPQYDSAGALDWSKIYSLKRSWSLGPQFKGSGWGRPDDRVGVGFGQIIPSENYRDNYSVLSGNPDPKAKSEDWLEVYYNYKVNDHLTLSPDLQIIWKPYGKDAVNGDGTIVIGGLRGQMDF